MPIRDRREIAFDGTATMAVMACSQRMVQKIGLLGSPPDSVRFDPHAGEVTLVYDVTGQTIPFGLGPLSALLISYCMRTGIKIPRHVERSIRVDSHAVVLVFNTNYQIPPTALAS